jgi:tellurite resistance protein TerC
VLLFWILFNLFVLAMLALDLGVVNRRPRRAGVREALAWSGVWIALATAFAVLMFLWQGRPQALQFVTGYVIELSLSVDNLFVFLVVFRYFKVPDQYQHKVLSWGILGALLMRGVFIVAGVGLIHRFSWITYVFGALLVYSGLKLLGQGKTKIHPDKNLALRLFRKVLPVTEEYVNGQFFTRRSSAQGSPTPATVLYATPLLVVLLVVETTDILFAVDSVPAVLAITLNPFIVYTSNVFAILGLRSMYFALAGMIDRFRYLHYGLSVVLVLIGLKMLASHYVSIPTEWALAIVLLVLGTSILASLANPQKNPVE